MADKEYLSRLDSLARFYNAEFLAHIGYELTFASLAVASLLATANPMLGPFIDYSTKPHMPFTCSMAVYALLWAFFSTLALMWFFGIVFCGPRFPYSFKYLFARSQYYAALSEIIWTHMGVTTTPAVCTTLRRRVARPGRGEREAIVRFFEARLYVSNYRIRVSNGGREDNSAVTKNLMKYFGIKKNEVGKIISPTWNYYNERLMLWNRAELLTIAYEPTLREYDYKVSGDEALDIIAKLIRDC